MRILLSLVFLLLCRIALAQSSSHLTAGNADCVNAIIIRDSVFGPTDAPAGYGNVLEIKDNDPGNLYYFEKEHNTVWYKFRAKCDGGLLIDIIPVNANDDYDFSLYRYTGETDFCEKLARKEITPVRTCISRNDKKLGSCTGLSAGANEKYIHSGVGASYVQPVQARAGDWFYLLVDNVYSNGSGHTVKIRCGQVKKGEVYVGMKLKFNDISFASESDELLPASTPSLDSLTEFLSDHPGVKVEIQGHVNAPLDEPSVRPIKGIQWLSDARAKAVYSYLMYNGINPNRLTPKGYGNSYMIYPNAKTMKEYKANMRVEIVVVDM